MSSSNSFSLLLFSWLTLHVHARIHHLILKEDARQYFKVSTFGYLFEGSLRVNVEQFSFSPYDKQSRFGFTLLKTRNDGLHPFAKEKDVCILDQANGMSRFDDTIGLVSIIFDFEKNKAIFRCSPLMKQLRIEKGYNNYQPERKKRNLDQHQSNTSSIMDKPIAVLLRSADSSPRAKSKSVNITESKPEIKNDLDSFAKDQSNEQEDKMNMGELGGGVGPEFSDLNVNNDGNNDVSEAENYCKDQYEIDLLKKNISGVFTYSFAFHTFISDDSLIGLYSLYFHSCPNYHHGRVHEVTSINLSMLIEEKNYDSYLSAGEAQLPQLYFILSVVFFILGLVWTQVIRTRRDDAFKIHYLMGALVFVKALALLFHSIDYHFIAQVGSQNETWAILYYTTHFLKGALLFITIALIGTGWAFVKHILSDKDKKIFMVVIPLQVLANVAEIITEESEEGQFMHNIWRTVFLLVDLICCGAILFPIVWSIRHLQDASQTDGKAAINLRKLKLFRRFYVMIVCYIYFTRIIVFILKLVVPFQFEWLDLFFQHAATFLFFISTGYHFQPTHSNPYFQLSQQEDLEMEEVLFNVTPNVYIASSTKKRTKEKNDEISEDRQTLITKRENSNDFD